MKVNDLQKMLIDEVFKAFGLGGVHPARPVLEPLFALAARRFAEVAVHFDQSVALYGFREAARRLLPRFTRRVLVQGAEAIPINGPLLILSNHPGTVDGLVIAAHLPRSDLKIVISGVPFIRSLRSTANYLIYSSLDTFERMNVVRSVIRHLREDGAVLLFPSGGIDPDPAVMPGALQEIGTWSPSLEVILRHVPSALVVLTAVSGVLHPAWVGNPLTRLRSGRRNQQRIAEFLQMIQQVLFPHRLLVSPSASFAEPLIFTSPRSGSLLPEIIDRARAHFETHQGYAP